MKIRGTVQEQIVKPWHQLPESKVMALLAANREQGLDLAFKPKGPGIMQRPPRDPKAPILPPELLLRVGLVSELMLISAFLLFRWELAAGATLVTARTVAANVFVVVELCDLLNCRSLTTGFFQLLLLVTPLVFAGILAKKGTDLISVKTTQ